jgi:hypothetical protein
MLICNTNDCAGKGINKASPDEAPVFCGLCGVEMTANE